MVHQCRHCGSVFRRLGNWEAHIARCKLNLKRKRTDGGADPEEEPAVVGLLRYVALCCVLSLLVVQTRPKRNPPAQDTNFTRAGRFDSPVAKLNYSELAASQDTSPKGG
jgi:hypothetical protein